MSEFRPVIRIAPNNQVFDLPVIVGIEEGLFEAAGLDVKFSATHAGTSALRSSGIAKPNSSAFGCP